MKIGGLDPKTLPNEEILVLPRGDQQLVIRARGISDMDAFNALCPQPQAPVRFGPGGEKQANTEDAGYKATMAEYNKRHMAYLVVASLEPSNIEWDTVKLDVPGSWANWEDDLLKAGLNRIEVNRIGALAFEANALDENKLKKARELFLRGPQQDSAGSPGPNTAPATSPSGPPASE